MAEATRHPDVAVGLAEAYCALSQDERWHLIPLVAADADRHGAPPGAALAVLLAAEEDARLARRIADVMMSVSMDTSARTRCTAWLAQEGDRGSAAVVRPLHAPFAEIVALWWDGHGAVEARHERMVHLDATDRTIRSLALDPPPRPTDFETTIDTLAGVLWRRRKMPWPSDLARLADLFGPISPLVRG
ncbi:MAG: hypothetical protein ACOC97_00275 [Myxococcota bacterium]